MSACEINLNRVNQDVIYNLKKEGKNVFNANATTEQINNVLDKVNSRYNIDLYTQKSTIDKTKYNNIREVENFNKRGIKDINTTNLDFLTVNQDGSVNKIEIETNINNLETLTERYRKRYEDRPQPRIVELEDGTFMFGGNIYPTYELALNDLNEELAGVSFSPKGYNNTKPPVGDNYSEYLRYLNALKKSVDRQILKLKKDRKNPFMNTKQIQDRLHKLIEEQSRLAEDINKMSVDNEDKRLDTLTDELNALDKSLDRLEALDIEEIKKRMDFLHEFITGSVYGEDRNTGIKNMSESKNPKIETLKTKIVDLHNKYNSKIKEIRKSILDNDITYYNNVRKNPMFGGDETQMRNLSKVERDINVFEKLFLGIGQASGKESVLHQVIKSYYETKTALRMSEVKKYKDRLKEEMSKFPDSEDFDFVYERSKAGNKTGNLIDVFSQKWRGELAKFFNIDKRDDLSEIEKNQKKITWINKNAEVVDFRKLRVIKDLYDKTYPNEFTYSDQEMDSYEKHLKNILGESFDDVINGIKSSLEDFQMYKDVINNSNSQNKQNDILRINPFEVLNSILNPSNNSFLGNNKPIADLNVISFIPKTHRTVGKASIETGFYNEAFKELSKDPNKLSYWRVLKEIYTEYINPTYNNRSMAYGKIEVQGMEEVLSKSTVLGKAGALFQEAWNSYTEAFYERGSEQDLKEEGVHANYSDRSKIDTRKLTDVLKNAGLDYTKKIAQENNISISGLNDEQVYHEVASTLVLQSYSTDINKITSSLLDMTATQKAREDTLPIANIIAEANSMIKDKFGNDRKNSIEKLEHYIEKVIKNRREYHRGSGDLMGQSINKTTLFSAMLDRLAALPYFKNKIEKEKFTYYMNKNEKLLFQHFNEIQKRGVNLDKPQEFWYNDSRYIIAIVKDSSGNITDRLYKEIKQDGTEVDLTKEEMEAAYLEYIAFEKDKLGLDLNLAGVTQGILKTIIIKALGLSPIAGIFNRVEGLNTNLMMDLTGKYWTTGNMKQANSFLKLVNLYKISPDKLKKAQKAKMKEFEKMFLLFNQMNLIQDRKDPLEKNIDSSKFNFDKHLNIFAMAVDNPEFKNQGAIMLSILMDTKIENEKGELVPIFDGKKFNVYDIDNGRLVLKDEFKNGNKGNSNVKNWENFEVDEQNLEDNQYLLTRNKMKDTISRTQGNYDEADTILASKSLLGQVFMLFKKWFFEHFQQRFSSGQNYQLFQGKYNNRGRYRYLWDNNPALSLAGLSGITLSLGLGAGSIGALGIGGIVTYKLIKNMYGGKQGIQQTAFDIKEMCYFARSIVVGTLNYPLELVGIRKGIKQDLDGYSNSNLTEEEIGALRACAKEIGVMLSYFALIMLTKALLWDDDDDSDSPKRRFHNFADNQLNRMINSVAMWQNPKALYDDVSRSSFVMWCDSVGKTVDAIAKGDTDKMMKYGLKTSPIPKIVTDPAGSTFFPDREYDAAQWFDDVVKDWKTDGEYTAKRDYNNERKDIRESGETIDIKKQKGESYKEVLERLENNVANPVSEKKRGRPKGSKNKPKENLVV